MNREILFKAKHIHAMQNNKHLDGIWILVTDGLPEEPGSGLTSTDDLTEYIVTIDGAERATTLKYAGDGEWYDIETGKFYKVSGWMPLPEAYQSKQPEWKERMMQRFLRKE